MFLTPKKKHKYKTLCLLGILLLFAIIVGSSVGPVSIPIKQTLAIVLDQLHIPTNIFYQSKDAVVVLDIRLPRVIVGGLVGAGLGVSGAIMQGLFRNPLVEPGYIGVSSGAAVVAVIALFFGWTKISVWILPMAAFIGALLALFVVILIWQFSKQSDIATLLLVGLGINLFLSAIISVFIASAPTEQELRSIVFWLQGGLEARTWKHVKLISPFILISLITAMIFARDLNVLLLGEDEAKNSGVHVKRTRNSLLILSALMTGAGVAVSGTIGFVGLVVPHMIRLLFGPDHRFLLPASALGGASFLVLADLISRMVIQPIHIQIGVVCALIGAPLFLVLVLQSRRGRIN